MTTHPQSTQPFTGTALVKRYPLTCFFAAAIGIDWLISLVAVWDATLFLPIALGAGALFFGGEFPFHWQRFPLMLAILPVNLGEEIAWRGFALPRLQRRCNGLVASLTLDALWAALHFVIWTIGDPNPLPAILLATGWVMSLSVIITWLFNQTHGSVLLATILHAVTDTMFIVVSPLAETHIYHTAWTLVAALTVLVAVVVVLASGVDLGHKKGL